MKWVYGIAVLLAALQLIVGEAGSVSPNRANTIEGISVN